MLNFIIRSFICFCLFFVSFGGYAQTRKPIYTDRQNANAIVVLPSNVVLSNNLIDGYVKVSGNARLIFPVGDNGAYRPFAATGHGTFGAYFQANPSTAVTSNPKGGNYGPLPAGAPFSTTSKNSDIGKVSTKEYWDINGVTRVKMTLTWDEASGISALLNNGSLSNLCVVGWKASKWVKIPAVVDPISILGGASTLVSGSITMEATVPGTYAAYTFGSNSTVSPVPSLQPIVAANSDNNRRVNLLWQSDSENVDQYVIEKSVDGENWNELTQIDAFRGNSSNHSVDDETPIIGENIYRLKVLQKNGDYAFGMPSKIVLEKEDRVAFYPNPANERFFIETENPDSIKELSVYDISGRKLITKNSNFSDGIDVGQFKNGMYIVSITNSQGKILSEKLIIRK